jgi:hypothetical protein
VTAATRRTRGQKQAAVAVSSLHVTGDSEGKPLPLCEDMMDD